MTEEQIRKAAEKAAKSAEKKAAAEAKKKADAEAKAAKKAAEKTTETAAVGTVVTGAVETGDTNQADLPFSTDRAAETLATTNLAIDEMSLGIENASNPANGTETEITAAIKDLKVEMVPLDLLDESPMNFFSKLPDKKFAEMVASIKKNGIMSPLIIRPKEDGRYEILAGRNRKDAAIEAGLGLAPCRIVECDDATAKEILIDTNVVTRPTLSPMELARAYQEKKNALGNRRGQRTDIKGGQKGSTNELVAMAYKVGPMSVERYTALTKLIDPLQQLVDSGLLGVKAGYKMASLDQDTQKVVLDTLPVKEDARKTALKALSAPKADRLVRTLEAKNPDLKDKKKRAEAKVKPLTKAEVKGALDDISKKDDDGKQVIKLSLEIPTEGLDDDVVEFFKQNIKEPKNFIDILIGYANGSVAEVIAK